MNKRTTPKRAAKRDPIAKKNLTTAEIEALRKRDREERRKQFLELIAKAEEECRIRLSAEARVGGKQGGLLLVGAGPVLNYYEDFPGGKPPPREPEPEEKDERTAD